MFPYSQGQQDAVELFGLTKVGASPKLLATVGKTLKSWMPTRQGVRRFFIGEPEKFRRELSRGKALSKGSLIRKGFEAPGIINKAIFYGLPALDVVSTMRSDSPDKPGDLARILGGTAASMAMYRPLGLLGAMAGGMAGSALGGGAVSLGRKITGKPVQAPPPPQQQDWYDEQNPYTRMYFENARGLPDSSKYSPGNGG